MNEKLEIDCAETKRRMDEGCNLLLFDCREKDEVETCAIDGSMWIAMSELVERLAELEPHRQRPIVVYCHLGGRSLRVANWLLEQGFSDVRSMQGGIDRWAETIDPALPRY
jgi:adenylyltransferase/sulfurtransferase